MKRTLFFIITFFTFTFLACSGEDGSDGVNLTLTCPIHQISAVDSDNNAYCKDAEFATISFTVIDSTVAHPRPGESIAGRRLEIPNTTIIVQEDIPNRKSDKYNQYTTTEIGQVNISIMPNVNVDLTIISEGFLQKRVENLTFIPGEISELTYELDPTWTWNGDGPPDSSQPINVTVVIETVDFNGDIVVDEVVINDPIFNLAVDSINILTPNVVTLQGDVTINDVTIEDPTIVTNGTIEVEADGGIVIEGDDISVIGTGDTDMEFTGPTSLEIDGDVFINDGMEVDSSFTVVYQ